MLFSSMPRLISLENPVQSAIVIYLLLLVIVFFWKPQLLTNDNRQQRYRLFIYIALLSIFSYGIFAVLSSFLS